MLNTIRFRIRPRRVEEVVEECWAGCEQLTERSRGQVACFSSAAAPRSVQASPDP